MKKIPQKYQGLVIKALFFFTYASPSVWMTYFYVYLKEDAFLTGFEIGIIAGFQQFNNIFVLPVWGIWADRYGRKNVLIICLLATSLLIPVLMFLKGAAALTLVVILITLVFNPIAPLVDTIALDFEEMTKGKSSYGENRMWGSIGWGAAALITGFIINQYGLKIIFPISAALFFIGIIIVSGFYRPLDVSQNILKLKRGIIWETLSTENILLSFLLIVFVYSVLSAPTYIMINIYFNEIGASSKILGTAFLVQGISELPFFFYGKKLVNRFGAKKLFMAILILTGIRMFGYGLNSEPIVGVALGLFNGISFGLFLVTTTSFVHKIVPDFLRSTGQSLIYTFYAVGVAFGNIFSGLLMDYRSMRFAMLINASALLLLVLILLLFQKPLAKNQS